MRVSGEGGEGQWSPPPGWEPGRGPLRPEGGPKHTWVWVLVGCGAASFVGIFIFGILAAIAIPGYMRFNLKARQAEAKTNLGALYIYQQVYFAEHGNYAGAARGSGPGCFDRLEWYPEGPTTYSYFCDGEVIPCSRPGCDPCLNETDLSVTGDGSFVIMAAGNLDSDPGCDVWTMDDSKNLVNVKNDLTSY